jgi:hypothetical protein
MGAAVTHLQSTPLAVDFTPLSIAIDEGPTSDSP